MAWVDTLVRVGTFNGTSLLSNLLIFVCFSLAFIYIYRRRQRVWLINQIPGPKTFPILGNALEVNVEAKELFKVLHGRFCDFGDGISRAWIGSTPYVLIYKAKGAEVILSSQKYIDKSSDYNFLHPWLGTGLLTSTGRKWQTRRKMLTPAFHFKILEDFVEVFHHQTSKFIEKLESKADGDSFDIFPFITLCTLDIILETAMGRSINAQDNSDSDYVKAVYRILGIVQIRQTRPWLQGKFLFDLIGDGREHDECLKILHGLSTETIRERRKEFQEFKKMSAEANGGPGNKGSTVLGKRKRLAFLDLLLEYSEAAAGVLSDEDLREEVDTFMFEGHDTTAVAISWSLYLLGSHPEIQEKVFEEMDAIFGDSDRAATITDLREMKFLECCIKEALRLFPSVPFIARELQEEACIDGYKIPAHTTTMVLPYRLHRDEAQFPDPELYQPERFFPENSNKLHPYAYLPFSAGPRNCIGQKFALLEEKTVLSSIFRKFRVESTVQRKDLKILGELIIRPEDGTNIRLYSRT